MKSLRHRIPLIGLLMGLAATPASAQVVAGHVVDEDTGSPLVGAHVVLLDEEGTGHDEVFTDSVGGFELAVPDAGTWVVAADLIGYGSLQSEPFAVGREERLVLQVRLGVEAVSVGRVVVTSRVSTMNPDIEGFYDRVDRGRLSGLGRFVTREDLETRMPSQTSDLLRAMPGVRVVPRAQPVGSGAAIQMSGGCTPAIYVDGTQINRFPGLVDSLDDFVSVAAIEGIEVYRGAFATVGRFHDDRGCGLILVWTRRGSNHGGPFSWTRLAVGVGLLLGLFMLR